MKREYQQPRLAEYGPMVSLTMGTGSVEDDLLNGVPVSNTGCDPVSGGFICTDTTTTPR